MHKFNNITTTTKIEFNRGIVSQNIKHIQTKDIMYIQIQQEHKRTTAKVLPGFLHYFFCIFVNILHVM